MSTQNGMEKPVLSELPTISDRMTFLYLEHCRISREDGAVTVRDSEGTVYIPAAAITVTYSRYCATNGSLTGLWCQTAEPSATSGRRAVTR